MSARIGVAIASFALCVALPARAQHHDHAPPAEPEKKVAPKVDAHAGHAAPVDDPHAGHASPAPPTAIPAKAGTAADPHAGHNMPMPMPVPAPTDAERAAAFPELATRHAHARAWNTYLLVDRLEAWRDGVDAGRAWSVEGWVGGDVHRLWLRGEGDLGGSDDSEVALELLYGRSVSAWWDVVAGARHEHGADPAHTWVAVGVQGLAPYKIEVKATAYLDRRGHAAARAVAEYETLLSSRWIVQWEASAEAHGHRDVRATGAAVKRVAPAHVPDDGFGHHGAGLATVAVGARLRYEVNRRFAPYIGLERERAFGATADLRRAAGEVVDDTRVVAGVRFWF